MAHLVFTVCTADAGWPPEVWAVFGTKQAARQHVDHANWAFRVEPLPVYDSYAECPPRSRMDNIGKPFTAISQNWIQGRYPHWKPGPRHHDDAALQPLPDTPWGPSPGVVYAIMGADVEPHPDLIAEVELFYATLEAAHEHTAHTAGISSVIPFPVYARYADCPQERRYLTGGEPRPWSQCMRLNRNQTQPPGADA